MDDGSDDNNVNSGDNGRDDSNNVCFSLKIYFFLAV